MKDRDYYRKLIAGGKAQEIRFDLESGRIAMPGKVVAAREALAEDDAARDGERRAAEMKLRLDEQDIARRSAEAAERSAGAADRSADAADRSARTSKSSAKAAWVGIAVAIAVALASSEWFGRIFSWFAPR